MSKGFLNIKVGDRVIVRDEYSHDVDHHTIRVDDIDYDLDCISDGNPKGMRCYGTDLDYWNEEEQDYDTDNYITVVTEENFVCII